MRSGGKIAILLLLGYVLACSASSGSNMGTGHDWTQAAKDVWVKSCKETGGSEQHCTCMQAKMQEHYTIEDINDINAKVKQGQIPQEFKDFAIESKQECGGGPTPATTPVKSDESDD